MNYKVIITGSVGSGKTTAVNSLTTKDAVLTDAIVSGSDQVTRQRKDTTTVAMDYDVVRLNDRDVVHVYGTPGQERFDFMWDILSQGAHGVILLLDITRNYPFRDLKYYVGRFSELISSSRLIVGLTHTDIKKNVSTETFKQTLKRMGFDAQVVSVDARKRDDVTLLFHALLDIPHENDSTASAQANAKSKTKSSAEKIDKKSSKVVQKIFTKESGKVARKNQKLSSVKIEPTQTPIPVDTVTTESEVEPDETIKLTEEILHEVAKVEHVNGVSLTNSMGELLHSTIEHEELNEFIAFLSGITPDIESTLNQGTIHRIMLRSPKDDNLTLFVEHEKSLSVSSDRSKSVQALSQQIEDMLQWL